MIGGGGREGSGGEILLSRHNWLPLTRVRLRTQQFESVSHFQRSGFLSPLTRQFSGHRSWMVFGLKLAGYTRDTVASRSRFSKHLIIRIIYSLSRKHSVGQAKISSFIISISRNRMFGEIYQTGPRVKSKKISCHRIADKPKIPSDFLTRKIII